jgi:hypothetical protein
LAPVFEFEELAVLPEHPPPPPVEPEVLLPLPADTVPFGPAVTGVQFTCWPDVCWPVVGPVGPAGAAGPVAPVAPVGPVGPVGPGA